MSIRPPCDVIAVGNAIVDLQVRVDDRFLATFGANKGEMRLVDDERQARILATLEGHELHASSGGSAANTVVGIVELGGSAGHCGKVSYDSHGEFYVRDLKRLGIPLLGAPAPKGQTGRTGTCVILVTPDAQRTMFTNLGVSASLSPADIAPESFDGARWLYVEGYLFPGETTRHAALKAIEIAKSKGMKVALTASDPFVIAQCGDQLWDLIRGPVDLLFCNELEARALTGQDDPIECARTIHAAASSVALTLGSKGSLLMHAHSTWPIEGVPVDAVDTTGAGDMYAAGILYGLTRGLDWPTSGHLASHAAARVVQHLGARLPRRFTPDEMCALTARK